MIGTILVLALIIPLLRYIPFLLTALIGFAFGLLVGFFSKDSR